MLLSSFTQSEEGPCLREIDSKRSLDLKTKSALRADPIHSETQPHQIGKKKRSVIFSILKMISLNEEKGIKTPLLVPEPMNWVKISTCLKRKNRSMWYR